MSGRGKAAAAEAEARAGAEAEAGGSGRQVGNNNEKQASRNRYVLRGEKGKQIGKRKKEHCH